jgi:hypothetical protein
VLPRGTMMVALNDYPGADVANQQKARLGPGRVLHESGTCEGCGRLVLTPGGSLAVGHPIVQPIRVAIWLWVSDSKKRITSTARRRGEQCFDKWPNTLAILDQSEIAVESTNRCHERNGIATGLAPGS